MDSKKLEILMTAVNLGSFSKASEVVGYTQSGLTHLINGLEREIGMALIRRDHSGISLTENGEALLPAIRDYLSATAKLENQIAAITQKKAETIRVAAYASLAMHWMPEILYRFRRVCPDTDVDLRMVDHELEPFELLEEGRTDVIFAARQSHVNCDWTPLYNDIMYAILPEDYPTGGRDSFPIEEFDGKEFLMPYGRFDIDVNAALSPKGVRPQIRPCHVDDETVIRMVSKGLGVSMMTEIMMRAGCPDAAGHAAGRPGIGHGDASAEKYAGGGPPSAGLRAGFHPRTVTNRRSPVVIPFKISYTEIQILKKAVEP